MGRQDAEMWEGHVLSPRPCPAVHSARATVTNTGVEGDEVDLNFRF